MATRGEEFARSWPVLLAAGAGGATGVAVLASYSLGAFVGPLSHRFGWTRSQVTAAALFTALGYLAAAPLVGWLADRIGARRVAIGSQLLLVAGLAAMALLPASLWLFYLAYFLLSVVGAGTLPMTWSRAITGWFVSGRGLALGVSLFGTGIIGGLLPSYVTALVAVGGWKAGYLGMAALPLLLGTPLAVLAFREPDEAPIAPRASAAEPAPLAADYSFRAAVGTLCFWQLSISFFLAALGVSAVLVHSLPLLLDRGFSHPTAAALAGLFGLSVTGGRLVSGYCLDLFRGPKVALVIFAIAAVACGLLALAGANIVLCGLSIALVGLAAGAEADIAGYFTAKYFGRRNFGAIYGLLYAIYCIGGGIGPLVAGAVYDSTHNYNAALGAGVGLFLLAAVLAGAVNTPSGIAAVQAQPKLQRS